jgi:hypothetical protein
MGKPLINFNVPKGEKITTPKVVTFAVIALGLTALWNWSEHVPGIGPYAAKAKGLIRRAVGAA